jgi:hypothetical protein
MDQIERALSPKLLVFRPFEAIARYFPTTNPKEQAMNTIDPPSRSTESRADQRLPKWNMLVDSIANGSMPFPTDFSPAELKQLIDAVARKRRERFRRFIAALIARQMATEKAAAPFSSELPSGSQSNVHASPKSRARVPSR